MIRYYAMWWDIFTKCRTLFMKSTGVSYYIRWSRCVLRVNAITLRHMASHSTAQHSTIKYRAIHFIPCYSIWWHTALRCIALQHIMSCHVIAASDIEVEPLSSLNYGFLRIVRTTCPVQNNEYSILCVVLSSEGAVAAEEWRPLHRITANKYTYYTVGSIRHTHRQTLLVNPHQHFLPLYCMPSFYLILSNLSYLCCLASVHVQINNLSNRIVLHIVI